MDTRIKVGDRVEIVLSEGMKRAQALFEGEIVKGVHSMTLRSEVLDHQIHIYGALGVYKNFDPPTDFLTDLEKAGWEVDLTEIPR